MIHNESESVHFCIVKTSYNTSMGVRYGWSILLVIFLVVTGHIIYPLPTTVPTSSTISSFNPYYHPTKYAPMEKHGLTNHTLKIESDKLITYLIKRILSKETRSHNLSLINKIFTNDSFPMKKRSAKIRLSSEQYTIKVLPSPPRPVEPKIQIPDIFLDLNEGIGIVADDLKELNPSLDHYDLSKKPSIGKGKGRYAEANHGDSWENLRYFPNHETIDVQFLPWGEGLSIGEGDSDCLDPDIISKAARLALKRNPPPAGVTLVIHPPPRDFKCTEGHALEYFLSQLTLSSTRILIGAVEPNLCRIASHMAEKYDKLLILWSCLEVPTSDKTRSSFEPTTANSTINNKTSDSNYKESNGYGHVAMVTPLANQVARSVRAALQHLGWRKVTIITIDFRYWLGVAQILDAELRAWHHLVPAIQVLPKDYNQEQILTLVKKVMYQDIKAFLLVLPSASSVVGHVMRIAGSEGLTQRTALILVDPLLEPKPHYFPFSDNKPVELVDVSLSNSENITQEDNSETKWHLKDFEAKNSNLNVYDVLRNRTKGISVLTEKYLQQLKKNRLKKVGDNKRNTSAASSNLRKRSLNKLELVVSDINIAERLNDTNKDSYSIDMEQEAKNISHLGSENLFPSTENVMFKTPKHIASLPIEVARSVFLSVPKSIGLDEDFSAPEVNYSKLSEDHLEDESKQNIGEDLHFDNEYDAILNRLAYDSVSLASHVLRINVGVIHLRKRRRRTQKKNNIRKEIFSMKKELKKDSGVPQLSERSRNGQHVLSGMQPKFLELLKLKTESISKIDHLKNRRKKRSSAENYKSMKGKKEIIPTEDPTEMHNQIFNEIKKLQEHKDAGAEQRLESILQDRKASSSSKFYYFKRRSKLEPWTYLNKIETRLSFSTTFAAFTGEGFVHASGIRNFEFLLLDWKPSLEALVPILRIHEATNFSVEEETNSSVHVEVLSNIDWAFDAIIPRDPTCELLGVPCLVNSFTLPLTPGYLALFGVGFLIVFITACTAAVFIRNWLRQKELSKGPYKILLNSTDITLAPRAETAPRKVSRSRVSKRKIGSPLVGERPDILKGSHLVAPEPKHDNRLHTTLAHGSLREADQIRAKYNGDFVHMRYFYSPGNFEVKNRTMSLLKQMHDIRHENINSFLGLLCDNIRPGFVFDYCSRGSLEDIIKQKDIKLDWSFRLSLLTDLVRGVRYLHSSPLKCHGRLTSRNCVIDARWVLKVTDYGLGNVYEVQNIPQPMRFNKDLLWKAPELLRDESLAMKGTQSGDVFSFAIIMQEVVVRGEPYCMVQLTHPEIIARLKKPPPMIRPSVSKGAAHPDVINIMKQCWAELPDMRPDFNQIYDLFKTLSQGRRLNIVDTMFQMLEKYSSNLEDLIRERTEQLHVEKKKTEQLLNRMLPSSVADQLKLGKPVAPEEFDEVTIYFSDIVGFTTISAYSSPFEVVDLLNDLYTAFDATINHYNVYKVETIGDAYMVVGGVPCRIEDHASQIATMALDLLHLSGKFRIRHLPSIALMLRIGMHTGPCCAGVVGVTMPRYCLFGDTVNTASRMESSGSAWRIHVSETTASRLNAVGGYKLDFRGNTELKGKGSMPTFWLLGKDTFKKELPKPPEVGHSHGLDEELVKQGRTHYTARRDSTSEVMSSAIKMYNQNRHQVSSNLQVDAKITCPMSPFNSGLLPDKRLNRKMKESPIIVRVENYDSESFGENPGENILRLSPLPQSPDSDRSVSGYGGGESLFDTSYKPTKRKTSTDGIKGGLSYGGYNYVNPIRDSSNTDEVLVAKEVEEPISDIVKCNAKPDKVSISNTNLPVNISSKLSKPILSKSNSQNKNEVQETDCVEFNHNEKDILLIDKCSKGKGRKNLSKKLKENIKEPDSKLQTSYNIIDETHNSDTVSLCDRKNINQSLESNEVNSVTVNNNKTKLKETKKKVSKSNKNSKEMLLLSDHGSLNKPSNSTTKTTSFSAEPSLASILSNPSTTSLEEATVRICIKKNNKTEITTEKITDGKIKIHVKEKDPDKCRNHVLIDDQNCVSNSFPKHENNKKLKRPAKNAKSLGKLEENKPHLHEEAVVPSLKEAKESEKTLIDLHSQTLNRKERKRKREQRKSEPIDPNKFRSRSSSPMTERRHQKEPNLVPKINAGDDSLDASSRSKSLERRTSKILYSKRQYSDEVKLNKNISHLSSYKIGSTEKQKGNAFKKSTFIYEDRGNLSQPINQRSTSFQLHSLELPSPTESTML